MRWRVVGIEEPEHAGDRFSEVVGGANGDAMAGGVEAGHGVEALEDEGGVPGELAGGGAELGAGEGYVIIEAFDEAGALEGALLFAGEDLAVEGVVGASAVQRGTLPRAARGW